MNRIGMDVGGTFTDVVLVDETSGALTVSKVLNRPDGLAETAADGVGRALRAAGADPADVRFVNYGTTITTNAVIEGKGARTALVTNQGFRDILELGRFSRPAELIYPVHRDKPAPLVPRHLRLEVPCRIDAKGRAVQAPAARDITTVADILRREEVRAVAVCFLFSFLDPSHERTVGAALRRRLPGVEILLSSEVMPEFREFPRTSTTVFAAYVGPVLRDYLHDLLARLEAGRLTCPLHIFQSNGGVARPEIALKNPATTLLSGPAGAVIGASILCRDAGIEDFITMDIGGTSLDICLVRGGQPETSTRREIDYFPVVTPMLDVHTIGAGGGSVVALDEVQRVTVGPASMGADPGPACYGRGGQVPTLTDVNLVLGYLNPDDFAGGELRLHPDKAASTIETTLAGPLGLSVEQAAVGVRKVATNQIAEAIRFISIERGHDSRDFALVAFGGGGPLHAAAVAREMGIGTVVIPRHPGLFSAGGIAMSDFAHDYSRSLLRPLGDITGAEIQAAFEALRAAADDDLTAEGFAGDRTAYFQSLDLRYAGQTTEINVAIPGDRFGGGDWPAAAAAAFHARHRQLYGYDVPGEPIEAVIARLKAVGKVDRPRLSPEAEDGAGAGPACHRRVWFEDEGRAVETPVFRRAALSTGAALSGPAIIEEASSTTVVPPITDITVDGAGNILLRLGPAAEA